ncbi:MAG TPA: TIGR00730 family Rossman fold protein [Rectinemataceae bacterium]|nr:TIGR00730 family Rossman fold protein [Rectinemataceae bacterium]
MKETLDTKGNPAKARTKIASVCVFCGSSAGFRPEYAAGAAAMGRELGRRGLALVYGGGNIGTMGILARSALEAGASVTGVIPRKLYELVDHVELSELVVAEDMHERKARMTSSSDAFLAMPGGIGTLDELFEAWTWRQLGYHDKPVGLLNLAGFYDGLLSFLRVVSEEGFLKASMLGDLVVETDPARLLDRLETAPPIAEPKLPERRR